MSETDVVTGILGRIRYHENGFLIAEVEQDAGGKALVVKGNCLAPQLGARYEFRGAWVADKFGKAFKFDEYEVSMPTSIEAIRKYILAAKWIGPSTAAAVVKRYGEDTLRVLKEEPSRVAAEVSGVTQERAEEIAEALRANEANEKILVGLNEILSGTGIGKWQMGQIIGKWGKHALEYIQADPFALTIFNGIGFLMADKVRERLRIPHNDPSRIRAGILYVLKEAAASEGHTYLPERDFMDRATVALRVQRIEVTEQVQQMVEERELVLSESRQPFQVGWMLALASLRRAEERIAQKIEALLRYPRAEESHPGTDSTGLAEDQAGALGIAVKSNVYIVTGAPGTGKTYLIRRLIESFGPEALVTLCAPTGKAAKRMFEQTLRPASTIHSTLGAEKTSEGWHFFHNAERPLAADILVVDETSMLDVKIGADLFDAIDPSTRVFIVGDTNQLPSVGPGNVLRDLIASGLVPTAELNIIKRQDEGALIVRNCHAIKNGHNITIDNGSKDFFWIEEDSETAIAGHIVDLVTRRLPSFYKVDPVREIQVLAPLREKGDVSCKVLNKVLQEALNSNRADGGRKFAIGDKVIQTKNEWTLGLVNGDVGFVYGIDDEEKVYRVRFEDPEREVELTFGKNDLELAYCLTVHKFQGSEARVIVIPVHKAQGPTVMQRNWLYTAISRAREVCVLVGQSGEVPKIIKRQQHQKRWTALEETLLQLRGT
jgi:exodeoxyribonuclease V alpha subunit